MNVNNAGDFILSALGKKDFESKAEYYHALVGSMILAESLFELTRIRKILQEALKKK